MVQLLLLGVVGQWVVKPLLGILLASTVVPVLRLPSEVASGLVLVCSDSLMALVACSLHCLHVIWCLLIKANHQNGTHALTPAPCTRVVSKIVDIVIVHWQLLNMRSV